MRRQGRRNYFRRTLIIYTIVCLIPMLVLSSSLYRQIVREHEQEEYKRFGETSGAISAALFDKLEEVFDLGSRLSLTPWVLRLRSNNDILYNSIDHNRQGEIRNELKLYEMFIGVSDQMGIFLPMRGEVFTRNGLTYPTFFFSQFPVPLSDSERGALWAMLEGASSPAVVNLRSAGLSSAGERDLMLICPLDMLKKPRAVLYCYIAGGAVEGLAARAGLEDVASVRLLKGDAAIFLWDLGERPRSEILLSSSRAIGSEQLTCQVTFSGDIRPQGLAAFNALFTSIVIALLLSAAIALPLALRAYRPIGALAKKVGGGEDLPGGDELSMIESQYDRLAGERDHLSGRIVQYEAAMRDQLLTSLLHGVFAEGDLPDVTTRLRLDSDINYQVMVFHGTTGAVGYARACLRLEEGGARAELIKGEGEDWVLILEAGDAGELAALLAEEAEGAEIFVGHPYPGILGISKSYYDIRQLEDISYFYPIDWEVQLINQLKLGNGEMALTIISQIRQENGSRGISHRAQGELINTLAGTLVRVAGEFELDGGGLIASLNGGDWDGLLLATGRLCGEIDASKEDESARLGALMMAYVGEHFRDPDLSLAALQEEFGCSQPVLSRAFKRAARLTYYDYLSRLRIEEAKRLLREGGRSVGGVAAEVGYLSEATFQRAFKRYEGVSPKEYARG